MSVMTSVASQAQQYSRRKLRLKRGPSRKVSFELNVKETHLHIDLSCIKWAIRLNSCSILRDREKDIAYVE